MNEFIITMHNELVKPEDHWTCMGDLTMIRGGKEQLAILRGWISRMNGHKRLILGNHDHFPIEGYLEVGFEKIYAMHMIDNMRFTHIPVHPDSMGSAVANVHGHIHNKKASAPATWRHPKTGTLFVKPYINISMEMTGYMPVSLEQIKSLVTEAQNNYVS